MLTFFMHPARPCVYGAHTPIGHEKSNSLLFPKLQDFFNFHSYTLLSNGCPVLCPIFVDGIFVGIRFVIFLFSSRFEEKFQRKVSVCFNQNLTSIFSSFFQHEFLVPAHFKNSFHAITLRRGDPVEIECEAFGENPIHLQWAKDRVPFQPFKQPRYQLLELSDASSSSSNPISSPSLASGGHSSQLSDNSDRRSSTRPQRFVQLLRINSLDRRDSALFTCSASNAYGKDEYNVQLILQGKSFSVWTTRFNK